MSKKAIGDDDDESLLLIRCWAPITTRLLQQGGSSAWNYMDGAMQCDNDCFPQDLNTELETAGLLSKLQPAKTVDDKQMEAIARRRVYDRLRDISIMLHTDTE